jgi:hypothetical protein
MSTLSNTARTTARNAINALVDGGAGTNGTLRYQTSTDADLLVITLNGTKAITDATNGVSPLAAPVSGGGSWSTFSQLPSAGGVVAKVVLANKAGVVVETFSVGVTGSGEEFTLDSLTLDVGVAVTMTTAPTVTQRASYDPTP